MKKIAFVFGTRPEAIKMAPLIKAIEASVNYSPIVILTGQHPTMAKTILKWFGIAPNFEFVVDRSSEGLNPLAAQLIKFVGHVIELAKPDLVVVQGDTASAFAGAIAAFNLETPVAHLEAGLRTHDVSSPFPEEAYRQMISRIAILNMCPTESNRRNLEEERVDLSKIMVTGNTVVDAFDVVKSELNANKEKLKLPINLPLTNLVLVTTHRRENLESGIVAIASAVATLAQEYPELNFVVPMHPNPAVRSKLVPLLEGSVNVLLTEPLEYPEFIWVLSNSKLVLTDSGGVQEEAPILGIPALVMRENTERPEGVLSGGVLLVGANKERIVQTVRNLMKDGSRLSSMSESTNPYGDGLASKRCLSMIDEYFRLGKRIAEFKSGS